MNRLRIRTKLLLALISLNTVLALAIYWFSSSSFERGFSHYLNQQVLEQQTNLVQGLEAEYQQHGSWQWLQTNPEDIRRISRQYDQREPNHNERPPEPDNTQPRLNKKGSRGRVDNTWLGLIVLDSHKQLVVGTRLPSADAPLKPLMNQQQIIGYLAYLPRREMTRTLNKAFNQQQQHMFALIAAAMLFSSILIAWGITHWLNKRLESLTLGTHHLTAGRFLHRIPITAEDELAVLARDFNTLAQTLADNQQARQRWIIDISHELRTPLAILQGELEALRDGVRPLSSANIHSLWQEIQRLLHLVNDLHLLSQADAGSLSYDWQTLNLAQTIDDVLEQVKNECDKQQLSIHFQPISTTIRGDRKRLQQLWLNLAQNSLRYTDANGQLRITMHQRNKELIVKWEDSSPSVREADLPRLTERLFRVDDSRHRDTGGSGLGLSMVQAIADAHQAQLTPSISSLGGLCWTLSFPISSDE